MPVCRSHGISPDHRLAVISTSPFTVRNEQAEAGFREKQAGFIDQLLGLITALLALAHVAWPPEGRSRRRTLLDLAVVALVGGWRLARHAEDMTRWAAIRERLYAEIATDLAHAAGGAPCVLAATEIGALGYHYPGPVLDLVGLVSPEAVGRDPGDVLRESLARWLVTYDDLFDRRIVGRAWFTASFRLVRRIEVTPSRALEVYERTPRPPC